MSLNYVDTDTVSTGVSASSSLATRVITAIGNYCHGVLVEDPSTTDHAKRLQFAYSVFAPAGPKENTHYRIFSRQVVAIAQAQGLDNSTVDADVQTAVNAAMDRLAAA
jgi:hypothetical protein